MSETVKTKGISAQIDPGLHQAVRDKLDASDGMTVSEYITTVLRADIDPDTVTISLPPELRGEVERELQQTESTMEAFIALALQHELNPEQNKEENSMSMSTKTLAFQVPTPFFVRVKDRLKELDNISQKDYVIGLIVTDLDEADRKRKAALQEVPPDKDGGPDDDGRRDHGASQTERFECPAPEEFGAGESEEGRAK